MIDEPIEHLRPIDFIQFTFVSLIPKDCLRGQPSILFICNDTHNRFEFKTQETRITEFDDHHLQIHITKSLPKLMIPVFKKVAYCYCITEMSTQNVAQEVAYEDFFLMNKQLRELNIENENYIMEQTYCFDGLVTFGGLNYERNVLSSLKQQFVNYFLPLNALHEPAIEQSSIDLINRINRFFDCLGKTDRDFNKILVKVCIFNSSYYQEQCCHLIHHNSGIHNFKKKIF